MTPEPTEAPATLGQAESGPFSDPALFMVLSVELTGFDKAELFATGQAETYFDTVKAKIGPLTLQALLDIAHAIAGQPAPSRAAMLQQGAYGEEAQRAAVHRILMLWYTGVWFDTLPFGGAPVSGQAYVEGLVWRAIGAHPMAAKPQGFGAWALAPPADPLDLER